MNQTEITQITSLVIRTKYFSRSANKNFTFISLDTEEKLIKIGITENGKGTLKTLSFLDFNKKYMRDGVVED
jgi:hypothetical protein